MSFCEYEYNFDCGPPVPLSPVAASLVGPSEPSDTMLATLELQEETEVWERKTLVERLIDEIDRLADECTHLRLEYGRQNRCIGLIYSAVTTPCPPTMYPVEHSDIVIGTVKGHAEIALGLGDPPADNWQPTDPWHARYPRDYGPRAAAAIGLALRHLAGGGW